MTRGSRTALAGVLAAGAALAATEVVGLLDATAPSPLLAVQNRFVATFAGALKEVAVALFGTHHAGALTVGSVLVVAGLGAFAAGLEANRRWVGVAVFAAFGLLGLLAEIRDPQGSAVVGAIGAVVGTAVGTVGLWLLLDRFGIRVAPGADLVFADRRGLAPSVRPHDADPASVVEPPPRVATVTGSRREVVLWGLGTGAAVVTTGLLAKGVGDAVRAGRSTIPAALPTVADTAPLPPPPTFATSGVSPYVTPNGDFYVIDTAVQLPFVVTDEWRLRVTGLVRREVEVSYAELQARGLVEEVVTLACVSNEVGGSLVGNAVWTGVPLRDLLAEAGVDPAATQLVGESVDGFTAGFPLSVLDDPDRPALVAIGMNGEPLPRAHGFPARLVVSGLYGYVSATKWLKEIRLTTLEAEDGYWIHQGWAKEAPIKTQSRIDVPRTGANLVEGTVAVAGVAWAPNRGVERVEVRIDGGGWRDAELGRVASDDTWVQWYLPWDAARGDHLIEVRATDGDGEVQPEEPVGVLPDGAEGWHRRRVVVAGR